MDYPLPHYAGKRLAATESVFLAAAYRNSGVWPQMMAGMRDFSKSRGCAAVQCTAPVGTRFARLMDLNVAQCRRTNNVYLWPL